MKSLTTYNNGNIRLVIQEREQAWNTSQNYSHTLAQYNAYLNQVCLQTFTAWFEDWIKYDSNWTNTLERDVNRISYLWEFVNGAFVQIGKTRLALIPSNDPDVEDFFVPQEWIDIPAWTADYYLDLRVNLDTEEDCCWIDIWGFTTHRQLKFNGTYNQNDKTYSLACDRLKNLEILPLTLDLNVKADTPLLPSLEAVDARTFIEELGKRSIYSPRLHLPFEKWGALLENETYRQQLFDLRMGQVVADAREETKPIKKAIDLRQWLQSLAEKTLGTISEVSGGWQSYENLFYQNTYSVDFRSRENLPTRLEDDIDNLISLLSQEQPIDCRANAAKMLGKVGYGNPKAIQALSDLVQNEKQLDAITRVQAILSLQKLCGNTSVGFQANAKLIDLGLNLEEFKVALIIATLPLPTHRLEVGICLKSINPSVKLPPKIKVSILKKTGEPIPDLEIETRSDERGQGLDDIVEMSTFSLKQGTQFRVEVSFKTIKFFEDFIA